MKLVKNTECGPLVLCDACYALYRAFNDELSDSAFEDLTGKLPAAAQVCDLWGGI